MKSIYSRRSIRHFRSDPVPVDKILEIIKAGMNAPSAGNEQPWRFMVVNQRELLHEITLIHPHANMLNEAPAAIIVCADQGAFKYEEYWIQDCAAATQNMLLVIDEIGMGGVWLGVYPREGRIKSLRKLFKLPESIIPFAIIALGFPESQKPPNNRFVKEWIHWNYWGHDKLDN